MVTNPDKYEEILKELKSKGEISWEMRQALAVTAFQHTARYDTIIYNFLQQKKNIFSSLLLNFAYEKVQDLRYGENPHQKAALYKQIGAVELGLANVKQMQGKELSFNNLLDLTAALEIARDFMQPTVVIIKHNNPCGISSADNLTEALENAWVCDPVSAFGSVIGINRKVDVNTASHLISHNYQKEVIVPRYQKESGISKVTVLPGFIEAIIAPDYEKDALKVFSQRKDLRIIKLSDFYSEDRGKDLDVRKIPGGAVIQELDLKRTNQFKVVTKKKPTQTQLKSMVFAMCVAKHVKSNAIVLVKGETTVGIGAGQMSRVDSCIIASRKAGERAKGSILASDAMFPARDGLDAAADTGAVGIIQPGGSKRDEEVITAANERGLVMVFTGIRHFKH